jgi:hypothetical protein
MKLNRRNILIATVAAAAGIAQAQTVSDTERLLLAPTSTFPAPLPRVCPCCAMACR